MIFEAGASGIATASVDLPLDTLAGSFGADLAPLPAGFQARGGGLLRLDLGITSRAMADDLSLLSGDYFAPTDSSSAPGTDERIANFPVGNRCGAEYTQSARRSSCAASGWRTHSPD